MLCISATNAQRLTPAFGPCTDVTLPYVPIGLSAYASEDKVEIIVAAQSSPMLHAYTVSTDGKLTQTRSHSVSQEIRWVTHADLDGNGSPEYVALTANKQSVIIFRVRKGTLHEDIVTLPSTPDRLAIADIDNDGRKDILLFGKTMAGVLTLLGRPGNAFAPGPVLFPEISVSDLAVADLNGDRIADVVLSNWLNNQLVIFYGISKIVFSEQVAVALPSEPAELAVTPVTKHRTLTLAATMPEEQTVRVFTANAIGELDAIGTIAVEGRPSGVTIGDLNADGFVDIVTTTVKGILVSLGSASMRFTSPVVYGVSEDIRSWLVADVDADMMPDILFADGTTKRLGAMANSSWSGKVQWPSRYAVGLKPRGLAVRDLNGDNLPDVAVANSGSSSLSVLFNTGGGRLEGQRTISVSDGPTYLRGIAGEPILVTSHARNDRISAVFLSGDITQSVSYTIPTGASPYVILVTRSVTGFLEILARTVRSKDRSIGLSLFQQIREGQFLERSIKPNLPDRVLALTVDDLTRNGEYDLVLVTHDRDEKLSALSVALGDQRFDFKTITTYSRFSDSMAASSMVIAGQIDDDVYKDIVIVREKPFHVMAPVFANGDGTFTDSLNWIRNVYLGDDDNLLLRDVNGDGSIDIVYRDERRNAIMAVHGRGQRRFEEPRVVSPAAGVSSFRISSMRNRDVQDLIVSHTSTGTIAIEFDPFNR